jgi:hypothetical protein
VSTLAQQLQRQCPRKLLNPLMRCGLKIFVVICFSQIKDMAVVIGLDDFLRTVFINERLVVIDVGN